MFTFFRVIFAKIFALDNSGKKTMLAEEWLYQNASKPEHINLGLERCQKVLATLGLSKPNFKVITVAGTNGKGSTVQFLDSLLRHNEEFSVGRFTSPHLLRFNERIVINGNEVSDVDLLSAFEVIRKAANETHLSYFEYATIAALYLFAQARVDVAVLEIGLGGRLDASNAVSADVAVITNIALDHQDWLGDDLEVIAREKAGIMRSGKPVILAETNMPKALHQVAIESAAEVYQLGQQYEVISTNTGFKWESHSGCKALNYYVHDQNSLESFQQRNLAAAMAALVFSGFELTQDSIAAAVKQGAPLGRLQVIKKNEQAWLLDVAHNNASMQVLCKHLDGLQVNSNEKFSVVFGMLKDKDAETCIGLLSPYIQDWFVAELDSPRSLTTTDLNSLLSSQTVEICENVTDACAKALHSNNSSLPILVCGSFYTVADALKYLN